MAIKYWQGYIYDIIKPDLSNSKTDFESYVKYQFENEFDDLLNKNSYFKKYLVNLKSLSDKNNHKGNMRAV